MQITLTLLFVGGYLLIALEHQIKINKAAIALMLSGILWTILAVTTPDAHLQQKMLLQLGDTCEILIYLIGAMTIVDLIDLHGGFALLTHHITTRKPHKLLWIVVLLTFFMSAALDNMTTTIIMILCTRRLVRQPSDRWLFAALIVLAANSGGAWSPIGDITTIMLWMRGNVTAGNLIALQILPALASVALPTWLLATKLQKQHAPSQGIDHPVPQASIDLPSSSDEPLPEGITPRMSHTILFGGILCLLFVPVFKTLTGLPPYMGMMCALGVMWILTEILYDYRHNMEAVIENRVTRVLKMIDLPTILFFLGVLMAVGALQSSGILAEAAQWLDVRIHEVFSISALIGLLSSVVDNVPLVAAAMGMYPIPTATALAAASAEQALYLQDFVVDGLFWHLLTYTAGVGGSLLIIGSAAGVVAMGLERISFGWYLKKISWAAAIGFGAGMGVLFLEHWVGWA